MPRLEIFFLGDFRLIWNKVPLNPFPTRKARALFAYLVTHRKRTITRAHLAGIFWRDFSEERALRNLSTTLWRIRQIIPENYLIAQGDLVSFDQSSDYWLDTQVFEELCLLEGEYENELIAALGEAIQIYRGDFLEGLYEDWALVETERLRSLYIQALYQLMAIYSDRNEHQNALNIGLKLLQVDPLREDIHLSVMKIYALIGQRDAALQQFESCKSILRQELNIEPTAEIFALYDQVRAMPSSEGETSKKVTLPRQDADQTQSHLLDDKFGRIPLVGRSNERSELLRSIDRMDEIGGGLVLIEGEPGIGKTRLVEEISTGVEWRGMQVSWGYCGDEPYAPLIEILSQVLTPLRISQVSKIMDANLFASLVPLLPVIDEVIAFPKTSQFIEQDKKDDLHQALVACMLALSQICPHVLIIENWQHMDMATLEFLPQLAQKLSKMRMLILGTARVGELRDHHLIWEHVLELDRAGLLSSLNLESLSGDETRALVQMFLNHENLQDEITQTIFSQTQGNPLFILETLKSINENEQISKMEDGTWNFELAKDSLLPKGIQEVIMARLDKVTPEERMLLDVAAVLHEPFEYDSWVQIAGWDDETVITHSNTLLQRQLLVEVPAGYRFGHEMIRQVAYDQVNPIKRSDLHRQAGEVLRQNHPKRVEELAHHFHLAGDAQPALQYALEAGSKADQLYASQSAVDFYTWALAWAEEIGGDAGKLGIFQAAEKRGQALRILGDNARALDDFDAMFKAAESLQDIGKMAKAKRLFGWCLGDRLGDRERGLVEAHRALELASQADDKQLIAFIYRDMGAFHNMLGQYSQSIEALNAALEIFRDLGDQIGQASCLQFLAVGYHFSSQFERSLQHYQQALNIWRKNERMVETANTLCDIGYLLLSQGLLSSALEALQESKRIFEGIDARGFLGWVSLGIGALHRYKLQGTESLLVLNQSLAYAQETKKISPFTQSLLALHRGMALWGQGNFVDSFDSLDKSLVQARKGNIPTLIVGILGDYGRCLQQIGEVEQSLELYREALALAEKIEFQDGVVRVLSEMGLGSVITGSAVEGLQMLNEAHELAQVMTSWKLATASINFAEAYLIQGKYELALKMARSGVEIAASLELGELAIWGYLILGSILLEIENPDDCHDALENGLAFVSKENLSLARFRLLLTLERLSRFQSKSQRALSLRYQLQDFIERLHANTLNFPHQNRLMDELRRLSLLAGAELIIPCQGQKFEAVRKAQKDHPSKINILWTFDAGKTDQLILEQEGKVALRQTRILRLLESATQQGADPTREEIATALGVSTRTIRTDLRALGQHGGNRT